MSRSGGMAQQLLLMPTLLVGRQDELRRISELTGNPNCRLLTLVGPGGIGKTRLALEAARQLGNAQVVSLQPLTSPEFLVSAVAEAVGFQFYSGADPKQQLLDFLREKSWLIVLDNFEHLLDGVPLLSEILTYAPGLRLLVTSRERLDLFGEWVVEVSGLDYPSSDNARDADHYGAVELFVMHAQRVKAGFVLSEATRPAVVRICRLLGGMPLGIELAAAWVRALSCDAIADEIERSLDILQTSMRNVEPRHRTMRAVFEPTWTRLSQADREVFQQLSVFRGGFTREAAIFVAGASLSGLASFVDKALLRLDSDGRYYLHELLRQYAQEQLEQNVEDENRARDTHREYYVRFLQARAETITGEHQRTVLQEIAAEIENIRRAWLWAIQQIDLDPIEQAAYTLYQFCDLRGRYREGADLLEQAIVRLKSVGNSNVIDHTLALLFTLIGWLHIRLGQYEKAHQVFSRSHAVFRDLKVTPPSGFGTEPLTGLGLLATVLGDYDEGKRLSEIALEQTSARSDHHNSMIALYVLSSAALAQGDYAVAQRNAQRAYLMTQEAGNQWMMAYVLIVLGDVARAQGDYQQAQRHYQKCYDIQRELDNPEGMAVALANLGGIAWLQEDMRQSEALYQQSYEIYRDLNDPGGQAKSLAGLADAMLARREYQSARAYFSFGLKIASTILSIPLLLVQFAAIGELLIQTDEAALSVEIATLVIQNPSSERLTKSRAEQALAAARKKLSAQAFADAAARGQNGRVYAVALALLEQLAVTIPPADAVPAQTHSELKSRLPQDVEPLTERELEILRLIANGLSNREIAETLTLEVGTVKAHNHHIFSKLGVSNRVRAIARAQELGVL